MSKKIFAHMKGQHMVVIAIIALIVLSGCGGDSFLAGAAGAAGVSGCNLEGNISSINKGVPRIVADTENATVTVIRWDDNVGDWVEAGSITPMSKRPDNFNVPDQFLTTAFWFAVTGCDNWYSAQELLSSLVSEVETSGGDPNVVPDVEPDVEPDVDPNNCIDSGSGASTNPNCEDTGDSGGGGSYGD